MQCMFARKTFVAVPSCWQYERYIGTKWQSICASSYLPQQEKRRTVAMSCRDGHCSQESKEILN